MEQASGGRSGQRERIVIRGAYVLTCDGADRVYTSGDIVIEEGRITAVGQVTDEPGVGGGPLIQGGGGLVGGRGVEIHKRGAPTTDSGIPGRTQDPALR